MVDVPSVTPNGALLQALSALPQGIAITDQSDHPTWLNSAMEELLRKAAPRQTMSAAIAQLSRHLGARAEKGFFDAASDKVVFSPANQPHRHLELTWEPVKGDHGGRIYVISDMTASYAVHDLAKQSIKLQSQLLSLDARLTYCQLTKALNRQALMERLRAFLAQSKPIGLLYCDLDGFKAVNDCYGHDAGDLILTEVGQRLQAAVRSHDIIGRMGGDEFVVVLRPAHGPEVALLIASRIKSAICRPFALELAGHATLVQIGISIGVSIKGIAQVGAELLIKQADLAMYRSKAVGGNSITIYKEDMSIEQECLIA